MINMGTSTGRAFDTHINTEHATANTQQMQWSTYTHILISFKTAGHEIQNTTLDKIFRKRETSQWEDHNVTSAT